MAATSSRTCRVCGKTFEYCAHCAVVPDPFKEDGFCSYDCAKIFEILSQQGCGLISAEEAWNQVSAIGVPEDLEPTIAAHIERIKPISEEDKSDKPVFHKHR